MFIIYIVLKNFTAILNFASSKYLHYINFYIDINRFHTFDNIINSKRLSLKLFN